MAPVAQLCPSCGLCCNGVLFGDVELQPGDNADQLRTLGLVLEKKGGKTRSLQPCSCWDGTLCRIYDQRPTRCRTFECRLLQRVQTGQATVPAALDTIQQCRRQVERVHQLLRRLGQPDERLPLSRRFAKAMAEPIDLAADEEFIENRSELMLAVHDLVQTLERDFL